MRLPLKGERGQSMVEFAMLLPVFMFIVAGMFDFSRGIFYYNSLAEAARVAARYAIVHGENVATSEQTGPCSSHEAPTDGANPLTALMPSTERWCKCEAGDGTTGNPPNGAAIRSAAISRTIGMNTDAAIDPVSLVEVYCSWPDKNAAGSHLNQRNKRVSVLVAYTYQPVITSFIPAATLTLQGKTSSFIQY